MRVAGQVFLAGNIRTFQVTVTASVIYSNSWHVCNVQFVPTSNVLYRVALVHRNIILQSVS